MPERNNHKSGIALSLFKGARSGSHCVLEVGIDGPGQMRGFASMVRPDVAVLCGIGSEHGRSLRTLERTRDEKAQLLSALAADGSAVLNADDPLAASVANRTRGKVLLCGFAPEADVRVESYSVNWPKGNALRVSVHGRLIDVQTRLLGRQMVFPVLAALAAAHVEGVALEAAARRLASLEPAPGRMELLRMANGAVCIDDSFKGSLETFAAAVDTTAELPGKRKLLVVGDIAEPPGKQSDAYRRLGLPPTLDVDADALEARYLALSRLLHPDHQSARDDAQRARALTNSARLNEAYRLLSDAGRRAEHLVNRLDPDALERNKALDPAFLMESMELSEEAEAARDGGDAATLQRLVADVTAAMDARREELAAGLRHDTPDPDRLAVLLHELKVFARILRDTDGQPSR